MPEIITRKQAIERGLKHYFTGKPCKHGHVSKRYAKTGDCFSCNQEKADRRRSEKSDQYRQYMKEYYARTRQSNLKRNRVWHRDNPDYRKKKYTQNREKSLRQSRAWAENNRDKRASASKLYKARKAQRTPKWANRDQIDRVYAQAALASAVTGWPHHVDHIVPLHGKFVCGLHVEYNLQILPDYENIEKSNKFED